MKRCSTTNWLDIVTILISLLAFGFSIAQFLCERNRNRREATIHAFDELQKEIFHSGKTNLKDLKEEKSKEYVSKKELGFILSEDEEAWDELTYKMSLIEHFSVGINEKVYDVKILNGMAGDLIIRLYKSLLPIIEYKRKSPDGKHNYIEFEKAKETIIKLRKRKCQSIDY